MRRRENEMAFLGLGRMKPEKVFERGERAAGRIVGIDVSETSTGDSSVRVDDYAIEVRAVAPFVAGVRQRLKPDDTVRLGMEVVVRHFEGNAVIDWPATCGGDSWLSAKLLSEPPATGIADATIGLGKAEKKGVAGQVTINAADVRAALGGLLRGLHLDVTVRAAGLDPYDTELNRVVVPHYATHLCMQGLTLPAWVRLDRLDRVTIDWPAAAMADPGIGRPPAAVLAEVGSVFQPPSAGPTSAMSSVPDARPIAADVAPGHTPIDGVSFDMWVAIEAGLVRDRIAPKGYDAYAQQHGVPPGAWAGAVAGWQARMKGDWRLGAAFGEAYERAMKAKR